MFLQFLKQILITLYSKIKNFSGKRLLLQHIPMINVRDLFNGSRFKINLEPFSPA